MSSQIVETKSAQLAASPESQAFALLQRQATMLSASTLVPKEFQGNVANCAIGIEIAMRLKASPFMVIQNIDIIHGRPSFRASFLIAMVNASGRFSPLQFRMSGEGQNRECTAWAKDLASGETVEGPTVWMAMAKAEGWLGKNGSKWQTMPELMLRYRSAAFFARIYAPDITLGMQTAEEVADTLPTRDVNPQATESKLFTAPKPAPVVEMPKTLLVEIEDLINSTGIMWSDAAKMLHENGVLNVQHAQPEEASDDELREAVHHWPAIVQALKKGGKK